MYLASSPLQTRPGASSESLREEPDSLPIRLWTKLAISLAVIVPCFWHAHIEACDLGSHTYNAWLAELIERGQAPGLYIARQWNNVLFDLILTRLGDLIGVRIAEKIVVASVVLIFFWGVFAFLTAVTGRRPWTLAPVIAAIAYGWTFHMGFMNYYLSVGLAFLAIAFVAHGETLDYLFSLVLAAFAFLAHPVGFLWLVGAAIYWQISKNISPRHRFYLFLAALLAVFALHSYVQHRYRTFVPVRWHALLFAGPDQLVVFGHRYRALALAFSLISAIIVVTAILKHRSAFFQNTRIALELWAIVIFSIAMLWEGIQLTQYSMGFSYLPERLSLLTAVLALSILGFADLRKWHVAALTACAALFFVWIYRDSGILNKTEQQAEALTRVLPPQSHVIQTLWPYPGWRIGPEHIVDRACIGRCYLYSNYEPSSRQFRVRVAEANSIVVASASDGLAMREGRYMVAPEDLPLTQVYQCDPRDLSVLCLRSLTAGERNGRLGYQPEWLQSGH